MTYSKEEKAEYDKKYRELNREKRKEYDKKYYELNKEKISEKKAEYYKLNKEKIGEKISEYYQLNKEKIGEKRVEYRELNREKISEYEKAHHKEKRAYCIEYLGGKCVKCGSTERLEFDHIDRTTKKYTIAGRVTLNFDNLKEELNKCQLLCVDCHKIKTKSEWADITQRGDGQSVCIV